MIQGIVKLIILICIVLGAVLIVQKNQITEKKEAAQQQQPAEENRRVSLLKKYLLEQGKPSRVEVYNLTQKFDSDVEEIKKMKLPLDKNSDFYLRIQFFTDENDEKAPLIAQIRFLDLKNDNLIKEDSINLQTEEEAAVTATASGDATGGN